MPPGQPYQGRILLANGEWKPIENPSRSKDSFNVALSANSENLTFSHLEIQGKILSGSFVVWGPAIDGLPLDFTAIRE